VAADEAARTRYVQFAHGAEPGERARLIDLGTALGWFSPTERHAEQLALIGVLAGKPRIDALDVDLACRLDKDRGLDGEADRAGIRGDGAGAAALRACLADANARPRVLRALASSDERDVQVAQAYLRHHPDVPAADLRHVTREIAGMPASQAKVRALEALARLDIRDPETLANMAGIYANARTPNVQRAVAEVFIRSGAPELRRPEMVATLREHRVPASDSRGDLVDVLLAQLQS